MGQLVTIETLGACRRVGLHVGIEAADLPGLALDRPQHRLLRPADPESPALGPPTYRDLYRSDSADQNRRPTTRGTAWIYSEVCERD